jgi:hypothetical protein
MLVDTFRMLTVTHVKLCRQLLQYRTSISSFFANPRTSP